MKVQSFGLPLLAAASLLNVSEASAALYGVDISGFITSVSNNTGIPDGIGNSFFNYTVFIDDSVGPTSVAGGNALFTSSVFAFAGAFGPYEFAGATGGIALNDDTAILSGQPADALLLRHGNAVLNATVAGGRDDFLLTSGDLSGLPLLSIGIDVVTSDTGFITGSDFSGALLEAVAANPAGFALLTFRATFDTDNVSGNGPRVQLSGRVAQLGVTRLSPVPVPPAFGLLAVGLVALGGLGWRSRGGR